MMSNTSVCSVNYIDHVGVAVQDIHAALELFERVFGTPPAQVHELADQGVRATLIQVGQTRLELLEPLGEDTPVGRFIQRRGEGLHHLAFNVSDLPGKLKILEQEGLELVDREPREGLSGNIAFIHPRATRGASGPLAPTPSVDMTTSAVTTSNKQMPRIADIIAMLLHLQAGRPHRKWQPDPRQAATSCFKLRRPYACSPKSRRRAVRRQPAQLLAQRLILLCQELQLRIPRGIGLDRAVIGVQYIRLVFAHLRLDPIGPFDPGRGPIQRGIDPLWFLQRARVDARVREVFLNLSDILLTHGDNLAHQILTRAIVEVIQRRFISRLRPAQHPPKLTHRVILGLHTHTFSYD